jgi:hypothetical protein
MKFSDLNLLSFGHTIQITGAIFSGEGKSYLCFFPADENDLPLEVLELNTDEWNQLIRQTDLLETEVLSKASDGTLAKVILRKSARQVSQAVSWNVYRRDGYRCRYCGKDDVPLTVDHLVVWEECGPSIEANLVSACRKCNKTRGNMQYADWLCSPYYKRVSRGLSSLTRCDNADLLRTLDSIPRSPHKKSKR